MFFSGTVVKQGEVLAEVTATGSTTRFGKTAGLVEQAKNVSHFQKAVLTIGNYLIYVSLMLVAILVLVQLHRHETWLDLIQSALILTVASIPMAMPAVLCRPPPREDSAQTISRAGKYGVRIKMVTGDNLAIGNQIAGQLGLGTNLLKSDILPVGEHQKVDNPIGEKIEQADGFAEVFPEHKFSIVKILQSRDHITGMTGDGVNNAPALKQADLGIAVSGATDAARAAAELVLTSPGLSVIITAIEEARRIFERRNSYAIYRISETIRIMFFVVLAMIFFNFYPITAIMIILLAFLNDIPIMAIAYDHTGLEEAPVRWNMHQVIVVATAMGIVGVVGSFGMLLIAIDWIHLSVPQIQTYVFLKMAVAGHLVLFVARSKEHFWKRPWPAPVMIWSAVITKLAATLMAAYGFGFITPIA